jgi:hypothetical protein
MSPGALFALTVVDQVYESHGVAETVITSGEDGNHGWNSLHYDGDAFDTRTRDLDPELAKIIAKDVADRLGRDYDVVLEHSPPHLHVEKQPRRAPR